MQLSRSKSITTSITLFLMLTIATTCTTCFAANPVYPEFKDTYTYIVPAPNPVGVDQTVDVVFWLDQPPPNAHGAYGDRWTFTVEVTRPDGSKENLGTITSDPIGGGYLAYTPDSVGTYYFQASFIGGWINVTGEEWYIPSGMTGLEPGDYYYKPSTSAKAELTVQQEQLQNWPVTPLPTGYWTRPIDAGLREWYTIAGNWLNDGKDNPYTTGPESAHIVWTKPLDFGGITGGSFGDISYYTGSAYEGKWSPPVIMQGRLYYNTPRSDQPSTGGLMCVDLRTGEEIWYMNRTRIGMGVIYDYESPNQHGQIPYLTYTSGGKMQFYDPFTGEWLYTITNVPSGTSAVGPSGEPLIYQLNAAAGWLACWNASAIPQLLQSLTSGTDMWQWRPVGKTVDGRNGYSWNVTIPALPGAAAPTINAVLEDRIIGNSGMQVLGGRYGTVNPWTMWAISLNENSRGSLLWLKNYPAPPGNQTMQIRYFSAFSLEEGIFIVNNKEKLTLNAYDIDTGEWMWETEPFGDYAMYGFDAQLANGKLYASGDNSGELRAYDAQTGKLLWNWTTGSCELEAAWANWPEGSGAGFTIADGKIYLTTYEHSTTMPLYRGWRIFCVDAETGEGIWNITGLMPRPALADGYMVSLNGMDNQIYCFGKGPTATTVSASPEVSVHGSSVLLKGTVIDQSGGTKESGLTARFPSGVPAIADEYMTEWMEHVYKQQAMPTNAKGVEVTLDTLDPNGNFVHIGTATSDMTGNYGYAFTPEVPGLYTIIATFAGSNSYFGSYAQTFINVEEAPPATAAPEYPQPVDPTMTIVIGVVAIILAIAIVGILLYRKK